MKKFKTESKKVLDIMINSIYTNKEIFLRELLSNASDAIDKLYYKSLTGGISGLTREDFAIKVSCDKEARTLTIADNGIGMTAKELEDNLGTIAKSGSEQWKTENTDAKEQSTEDIDIIGRFGVGFYSAFMVGDKVEVYSRSFDDEKGNVWTSDGVEGYSIKSADLPERGTKIVIHLKPDIEEEDYSKFADQYTLRSLIKKYSDYIRYPIQLLVEVKDYDDKGEVKQTKQEWQTVNSMVPLWRKSKSEVTKEQYDEFYKETFYDFEPPLKVVHTSAEGVVDYKALLYIPSHAPYNYYTKNYEKGLRLYSDGVLITDKCEQLLPDYYSFVKGLVDSKLTLNISRETIQHDRRLKLIASNIEKKITSELTDLLNKDRENYEKFFLTFGLQLKYGVYADWGANKDKLKDLLLFYSLSNNKLITLKDYTDSMKEGQEHIYYACGNTVEAIKCLPQCDKVLAKGYDVLCLTDDVDEFALKMLDKYNDKPFRSVSAESGEQTAEYSEQDKQMLQWIKESLKGEVVDVVGTQQLSNHPVCLTTKGEVSIEMEKVLNSMPQQTNKIKADKVLEINVQHPVYAKLQQLFVSDKDKLQKYADILYKLARLIEGLPVDNVAELSSEVCMLLAE